MNLRNWFLCSIVGFLSISAHARKDLVVDTLKVTVLSDMVVSRWTHSEWGFAALVEAGSNGKITKILFDTGARPDTVLRNAKALKIELCDIEIVVLSHNHQDHTMGLVSLRNFCLNKNHRAFSRTFVGGREVFWPRPNLDGRTDDNVMVPKSGVSKLLEIDEVYEQGIKALYEKSGGKFVHPISGSALPVADGVWATGQIPRVFDEMTYPGTPMVVNPSNGKKTLDVVPEDQALVINTKKGLVVLLGCAHAGLINSLNYSLKTLEVPRLHAVIGGFHLFKMKVGDEATPGTLTWTAAKLSSFSPGIEFILGAHCTGIEALQFIRGVLKLNSKTVTVSSIGTVFDLATGIIPPRPAINSSIEL